MSKTNEKTEKTMKFAVVDINGSQVQVSENETYTVKKLEGDKGDKYVSDKVLLIADDADVKVGKPYVDGASVEFVIDSQKKGEKIEGFKYKAKARYRRRFGSRELITRLLVKKIKTAK